MPPPTALLKRPEIEDVAAAVPLPESTCAPPKRVRTSVKCGIGHDEEFLLDAPALPSEPAPDAGGDDDAMAVDEEGRPRFAPAKQNVRQLLPCLQDIPGSNKYQNLVARVESRKVLVPPHRFRPLQAAWPKM